MALSSISSTDNIEYYRHRTRRRLISFVRFVVVFYIMYQIVTIMLLTSYSISSISMSPQIAPGNHLLVSPLVYGARVPFTQLRLPAIQKPRRGDIVLMRPAYAKLDSWYIRLADPVVRFFTGQTVGLGAQYRQEVGNTLMVKRIIGIPGDTVEIRSGVAYIEPVGATAFSSELQMIQRPYDIIHGSLPEGWGPSLPLSQNMSPLKLKADQYFVLGDDRTASSDSASWGPVTARRIIGKVIFRYWPLRKLGAP